MAEGDALCEPEAGNRLGQRELVALEFGFGGLGRVGRGGDRFNDDFVREKKVCRELEACAGRQNGADGTVNLVNC